MDEFPELDWVQNDLMRIRNKKRESATTRYGSATVRCGSATTWWESATTRCGSAILPVFLILYSFMFNLTLYFLFSFPPSLTNLQRFMTKNKLKLQVLPMNCKLCCQPVATYMKIYNKTWHVQMLTATVRKSLFLI